MRKSRLCHCLLATVLFLGAASAHASSIPVSLTLKGNFTQKSALLIAQQVFANLSAQAVGELDPSNGTNAYYYELTDANTLVLHFQLVTNSN